MRLDIRLNDGLGPIKFGMRPAEVCAVFPEKQTWEEWMGGNLNNALAFHGLILSFDKYDLCAPLPDGRLYEITIYGREDVTLFDKPLPTGSRAEVIEWLRQAGHEPTVRRYGVSIPDMLEFSFEDDGRQSGVIVSGPTPHRPPTQRTGAAGFVSVFRKLLGRGSGR